MLSKWPNSVMVMAAHPLKKEQLASLQTIYQGWVVHDSHELAPFSFNEINCYFKTFLRGRVPIEMRQQITLLIGHKPVLIALVGEWLKRHTDFPPDIDSFLKEWPTLNERQRARCRQRFEFELVERWHFLRRLIDWSTLFLAYLGRRYDPQILQLTLELDDAEVKMVTEQIKSDLFIRKSISTESGLLHDEMQRLLMEHAWPVLGGLGQLKRMLARQVIDEYYLPKIDLLKGMEEDFLRRELQRECLDYHFRISEEVGLSYLDQLLTEAENYHDSPQQLEAISQEISQLGLVRLSQMSLRMARLAQQKKEFKQAVCLAQAALMGSPSSADAALALILLGKNAKEAKEKCTYLQNALQKAQLAQNRELEAEAHHQLGLLLQKQGKWPEAAQRYQKALNLLEEKKQPNDYAKSLNQLALVTMQSGNPMLALRMSEKALRIYKEQGNLYGKRISLATKARISQTDILLAQRHVHNPTHKIIPTVRLADALQP
jgi:tetratricopeptide (TPR) repeat protein